MDAGWPPGTNLTVSSTGNTHTKMSAPPAEKPTQETAPVEAQTTGDKKAAAVPEITPLEPADLTIPIDYVVFGLGIPDPNLIISRHNSGFIFSDYLANCIAMQIAIVNQANDDGKQDQEIDDLKIPETFKRPVFVRTPALFADIHDIQFTVSPEEDFVANTVAGQRSLASVSGATNGSSKKTFRIIIAKPLTGMGAAGESLKRILTHYQIKDIRNQLVVVSDDVNTLQGSISIHAGTDTKGINGHDGLTAIVTSLLTADFIRLQLGVGRPTNGITYEQFIYSAFSENNKEMDLFGHALDVAAQAFQYYVVFKDLKKAKQKYANSKKLPKVLRKMVGLVFPLDMEGLPQLTEEEQKKLEEEEKKAQEAEASATKN